MEVQEKRDKKNWGRWGCIIGVALFIIIIVLFAVGLINFPGGE